ncbi:hypothetical protein BVZ87_00957B, partial [Haemophilus influenzae]
EAANIPSAKNEF